jgi:hypothetical protein
MIEFNNLSLIISLIETFKYIMWNLDQEKKTYFLLRKTMINPSLSYLIFFFIYVQPIMNLKYV